MGQLKAKDFGGPGVRVSSPSQTRGVYGGQELGGLLAVRTKGLAPHQRGVGLRGRGGGTLGRVS